MSRHADQDHTDADLGLTAEEWAEYAELDRWMDGDDDARTPDQVERDRDPE